MRRIVQFAILISALVLVLRRMGVSMALGVVILNDTALARLATRPVDLIVVGMVTIPSETSPNLVASAVRRLRVLGVLQGDPDAVTALHGRAHVFGAIQSRGA